MSSSQESNNKTPEEAEEDVRLLGAIDLAIVHMQEKLISETSPKGSLAELLRLIQLRREMEGDRPRHVSARWIEDECRISND